jgi:hypothetical protein
MFDLRRAGPLSVTPSIGGRRPRRPTREPDDDGGGAYLGYVCTYILTALLSPFMVEKVSMSSFENYPANLIQKIGGGAASLICILGGCTN